MKAVAQPCLVGSLACELSLICGRPRVIIRKLRSGIACVLSRANLSLAWSTSLYHSCLLAQVSPGNLRKSDEGPLNTFLHFT